MIELLSPAGTFEKLKTAVHFGADAVYFSGKEYGMRTFAGNFTNAEMKKGMEYLHACGKKGYVTINIFAKDKDFIKLPKYLDFLQSIKADAVIVADLGILAFIHNYAPKLELHVSTQANLLNSYELDVLAKMGAKRVVLARELSIKEIQALKVPKGMELECFVHGAMCIAYSGRCLLSKYLVKRDANRGSCAQACRWQYKMREVNRGDELELQEDELGSYVMNSKDLCMIEHIDKLAKAGVTSFKIEGRMKSEYYVAAVTNSYRRAINNLKSYEKSFSMKDLLTDLQKPSHRRYTTGFYLGEDETVHHEEPKPVQTHEFMAQVIKDAKNGWAVIEMRNRFKAGDQLEILSRGELHNKMITMTEMRDEKGNLVEDAKLVQQKLKLKTELPLKDGDILIKIV